MRYFILVAVALVGIATAHKVPGSPHPHPHPEGYQPPQGSQHFNL